MAKLGIKPHHFVVTYDTDSNKKNIMGYRCAWVLQALGHNSNKIKVLDGSGKKWIFNYPTAFETGLPTKPTKKKGCTDQGYRLDHTKLKVFK